MVKGAIVCGFFGFYLVVCGCSRSSVSQTPAKDIVATLEQAFAFRMPNNSANLKAIKFSIYSPLKGHETSFVYVRFETDFRGRADLIASFPEALHVLDGLRPAHNSEITARAPWWDVDRQPKVSFASCSKLLPGGSRGLTVYMASADNKEIIYFQGTITDYTVRPK